MSTVADDHVEQDDGDCRFCERAGEDVTAHRGLDHWMGPAQRVLVGPEVDQLVAAVFVAVRYRQRPRNRGVRTHRFAGRDQDGLGLGAQSAAGEKPDDAMAVEAEVDIDGRGVEIRAEHHAAEGVFRGFSQRRCELGIGGKLRFVDAEQTNGERFGALCDTVVDPRRHLGARRLGNQHDPVGPRIGVERIDRR